MILPMVLASRLAEKGWPGATIAGIPLQKNVCNELLVCADETMQKTTLVVIETRAKASFFIRLSLKQSSFIRAIFSAQPRSGKLRSGLLTKRG
jgi:hypothetical protein